MYYFLTRKIIYSMKERHVNHMICIDPQRKEKYDAPIKIKKIKKLWSLIMEGQTPLIHNEDQRMRAHTRSGGRSLAKGVMMKAASKLKVVLHLLKKLLILY